MKHRIQNERGIALIVSVLGLVMIGALVTATFTTSIMEHRVANNSRRANQAFAMAELGLNETIGNWNTGAFNGLAVLDSAPVSGSGPGGSGSYAGVVRRMNPELFLVDVVGRDAYGGARQRVASFVKLQILQVSVKAALTTQGATRVGGSAEISGLDMVPTGWGSCGPLTAGMPGVAMPDVTDLTTQGACSGATCITGNPPVLQDPTIDATTFNQFGDLDWAGLTAMATMTLAPGTYASVAPSYSGTTCNTADIKNWGEPMIQGTDCSDYFPVIHVPGDMVINGNYGQGILLVDGDLSVQGGLEFFGLVVVRGRLKTTGTGGHFNGAVLSANVDLDQNTVLGDALVQYSNCALNMALLSASMAAPLVSRGWVQAF